MWYSDGDGEFNNSCILQLTSGKQSIETSGKQSIEIYLESSCYTSTFPISQSHVLTGSTRGWTVYFLFIFGTHIFLSHNYIPEILKYT